MIGMPAMVVETFVAMVREITGQPWVLLGEFVQFAILAAGVWLLAVGFGKRQGILAGYLVKRRERVEADLLDAREAPARSEETLQRAQRLAADARAAAAAALAAGRTEAEEIERRIRTEADEEAARIAAHVDEALASEETRMLENLRARLVETVAQATRSVMSASLSASDQRRLIERAVVAAVSAGDSAPSGPTAGAATDLRPER